MTKSVTSVLLFASLAMGCISKPEPWQPQDDEETSTTDAGTGDARPIETPDSGDDGSGGDSDLDCTPSCDGVVCGNDGCGGSCGNCGVHEACVEGQCSFQPECDPYANWVCFPEGQAGENLGRICKSGQVYAEQGEGGECETYKDCPGGSIDDQVCLKSDVTGTIFGNLDYWPTEGGKCFHKCKESAQCDALASGEALVCDNLFGKLATKVCMVPGAFVEFDDAEADACPE